MLKQGLFKDFKPEAVFGLHVFSSVQAGPDRGAWRDR